MDEAARLFRDQFGKEPEVVARAPGRVEFVGNHLDYNGGPVLGLAIDRFVSVAVSARADGQIRFLSAGYPACQIAMEKVTRWMAPPWINYPLGVFKMMEEAGYLSGARGYDLAVASDLPAGAGLSSSAALEMASAYAFGHLFGAVPPVLDMVRLCRRAENEFVGVPCGILDQGVIGFARQSHLVAIDCQHEAFSVVPFPADWSVWIFPSGGKHNLVDSLYVARHRECSAVLEKLRARHGGLEVLARATVAELEEVRADLTAEEYRRGRHVVEETARVRQCMELLGQNPVEGAAVGAILTASHQSSRQLFENSTVELDHWVEALVEVPGVLGARLTGGGFGGAVMALANASLTEERVDQLLREMYEKFGYETQGTRLQTADGARRTG